MGLRNLSYSLNGLPSDLRHDGTLSPKVLIAQAEEVVDDKGCGSPEQSIQVSRALTQNRAAKQGLSAAALSPAIF